LYKETEREREMHTNATVLAKEPQCRKIKMLYSVGDGGASREPLRGL
jgi:hypothetical protein